MKLYKLHNEWAQVLQKAPYLENFLGIIEHSRFVAMQVEFLCREFDVHPVVTERAIGLAWLHDFGKAEWLRNRQLGEDTEDSDIELGLRFLRGCDWNNLPKTFADVLNLMPYLDAQVLTSCQFVSLPFEPKITLWADLHAQEAHQVEWSDRKSYLFNKYFLGSAREPEFPDFIAVREKFRNAFMAMRSELSRSSIPVYSPALHLARTLGGWLYDGESQWLYELVRRTDELDNPLCEIGSWRGRSTVCIVGALEEAKSKRVLYCVDDWLGGTDPDCRRLASQMNIFAEFYSNTSAYHHRIKTLRGLSMNAANSLPHDFSFVFLDGDHSAGSLEWEVDFFALRIVKGGLLAFHDVDNPAYPAVRAMVDCLVSSGEWVFVGQVSHLCALEKK